METAALTFRTKQYSTSYSSHICYGKQFYNDLFLNHNTIGPVHNCLKLLSCVVNETALDGVKKNQLFNSVLSTRKRSIERQVVPFCMQCLQCIFTDNYDSTFCFWILEKRLTQENCFLFCNLNSLLSTRKPTI